MSTLFKCKYSLLHVTKGKITQHLFERYKNSSIWSNSWSYVTKGAVFTSVYLAQVEKGMLKSTKRLSYVRLVQKYYLYGLLYRYKWRINLIGHWWRNNVFGLCVYQMHYNFSIYLISRNTLCIISTIRSCIQSSHSIGGTIMWHLIS